MCNCNWNGRDFAPISELPLFLVCKHDFILIRNNVEEAIRQFTNRCFLSQADKYKVMAWTYGIRTKQVSRLAQRYVDPYQNILGHIKFKALFTDDENLRDEIRMFRQFLTVKIKTPDLCLIP